MSDQRKRVRIFGATRRENLRKPEIQGLFFGNSDKRALGPKNLTKLNIGKKSARDRRKKLTKVNIQRKIRDGKRKKTAIEKMKKELSAC